MRKIHLLLRLCVGLIFIVSGLIKVNDPWGTAIKLEEYFEVFAADTAGMMLSGFFLWCKQWALPLSILVSSAEVVLGTALAANFKPRLTQGALLLLVAFFGVLTFYSAYFNKVTDCGCFGEAIKFTPWGSFTKDMLLGAGLLLIAATRPRKPQLHYPPQSRRYPEGGLPVLASMVLAFGLAYQGVEHLPLVDFSVYRIGESIPVQMRPSEPCRYEYHMEKDGKVYTFTDYPTDPAYTFKEMRTLNAEACKPKIMDFSVSTPEGEDSTEAAFAGDKLLLVVHDTEKTHRPAYPALNALLAQLPASLPVWVLTSDASNFPDFRHEVQLAAPYFLTDATVLKTMMRSNFGLLLLHDGKVVGKWHYNDLPTAQQLQSLTR